MHFTITIKHERRGIRLLVELLEATDSIEKYRVKARNQSFVLQSNRPLIRGKGLKHFPISWKVIEGSYHHTYILEQIIKAIEKKITEV